VHAHAGKTINAGASNVGTCTVGSGDAKSENWLLFYMDNDLGAHSEFEKLQNGRLFGRFFHAASLA